MTDPAANVRTAFRYVTLGLMEWQDPPAECPLCGRWASLEGRQLHVAGCHFDVKRRHVYRPWDPQGETEPPYDVQADWEEYNR